MNRYVHQIPFAAEGAFVWNRNTVHEGQAVRQGDPVNNAAFTSVRLRQMYDARMIVPAPFGGPPPRYLENGRGKADKLRAEIEREEKTEVKGDAPRAQPRPAKKSAPAHRTGASRNASTAQSKSAKTKPAAKRAGGRSR